MASTHCIPHLWVVHEPTPTYQAHPAAIRTLKVRAGHYDYQRMPKPVPWIYLKGYWLEQAGFSIGATVQVQVSSGRIVVTMEGADAPSTSTD